MNVPRARTRFASRRFDLLARDDVGEEDVGIDEDAEREARRRAQHAADHEREDPLRHGRLRPTWSRGGPAALLLAAARSTGSPSRARSVRRRSSRACPGSGRDWPRDSQAAGPRATDGTSRTRPPPPIRRSARSRRPPHGGRGGPRRGSRPARRRKAAPPGEARSRARPTPSPRGRAARAAHPARTRSMHEAARGRRAPPPADRARPGSVRRRGRSTRRPRTLELRGIPRAGGRRRSARRSPPPR